MSPIAPWLILGLLPAMVMSGCSSRQNYLNENDRLRAEVLMLQDQVRSLEQRNLELEQALTGAVPPPESIREDVLANTPRVAAITIDRLSHLRDTDGDGRPDRLIAYVKPADGRGRFVQIVGDMTIHAALLPSDADAVTILRETLGPAEVRDTYRYSMAGIHYAVEKSIEMPSSMDEATLATQDVLVRVMFVDGYTGRSFAAERALAWRPSVNQ